MMTSHTPSCPECGTITTLTRVTRGHSGFDIQTLECPQCDHVYQTVSDLVDPMKSRKVNRWLMGQLQGPR